jgi:hypothetical protein
MGHNITEMGLEEIPCKFMLRIAEGYPNACP